MSEKWNDGQLKVINNTTGNMIVSASAGSGKTATMIERVKRLILDKGVPVERILMLSFNEAIASEIKEKMAKSLIAEVKTSDNKDFLREQIDALGMADITTMHAFCNSLIKEYFDIVGVDPAYSIMDDKESNVIINKSINEVFDEYFESKDSEFLLLKDKLSANGDDELRNAIVEIFKFSNSLLASDEWLDNAIMGCYGVALDKAKPVKYLVKELITKVNNLTDVLEEAMCALDTTKYYEIPLMLERVRPFENEENIIKYAKLLTNPVEMPRRNLKNDNSDKPYYTNAKDTYKDVMEFVASLFPVGYDKMADDHRQDAVVVRKLIEVVRRFKTYYNREKAEVNKLDFNDMEHYAVEILSHEDIASSIKAKYEYVCVDEYQDTNEVQNTILNFVSRDDNLFMVGDPKQSIYKFRFTEPEIFVNKLVDYSSSKDDHVVELDKNYRSSPLILEKVNEVFDNLMQRPDAGMIRDAYSSLENGLEFDDKIDRPFEVMLYETSRSTREVIDEPSAYRVSDDIGESESSIPARIESEYIADKVAYLLGKQIFDVKAGAYRDIRLDDMAILASSRSEIVKEMLDILEQEYHLSIDATYLKKKDEPQEVKILLDFLRAVDNPRQDVPLYTIMKMFFDFTDSEFVAMKREAGKSDHFFDIIFGDIVHDTTLRAKIDTFRCELDEYRMMSTFMNVHDFLLSAIEKSDFKRKLLMSQSGKVAIDNIDKFLVTLKDKRHSSTIQEFLYAYDNYNVTNDVDSTSQSMQNSIHTSTIHQSKGLEYPIVFIVNAGANLVNNNMTRANYLLDKSLGFAMRTFNEKNKTVYSNWLIKGIIDRKKQEEKQEKLRLLYVAMTRAKNCLYIVGNVSKNQPKFENINRFSEWLYAVYEQNDDFAKYVTYKNAEEAYPDEVGVGADVRAFDYAKYSKADAKRYADIFDYRYPYEESTKLAQKYTVTSINHEEREQEEYVPELYETEKTSVGSIYHKFMEHVNYEANTIGAIKDEFSRMIEEKILTADEISNILIDDVYKCLNSDIIKKAKANKHEREKKFMMNVPLSSVRPGASDEKVIIQGIADLVIYGEENILVDFKKSSLPANMLKENYKKQLELYNYALSNSMNIKFDHMYLYVIGQDKTIEIDK